MGHEDWNLWALGKLVCAKFEGHFTIVHYAVTIS